MKTFITKDVGRRKFLGDCGKMTGIGAMSSVINLQMMTNVVAQKAQSDFKACDAKSLLRKVLLAESFQPMAKINTYTGK